MKLKKFTIIQIFTIMLAVATFYGCQQEDILQEQSDIQLKDDTKASFLSFDSKSDYEKVFSDQSIIESKESMQEDFISLKSTIESFDSEKNARTGQRLEDTLYADYGILPQILNRDKIVKIGNYLIKVDLHTETVLVLELKHRKQYKDLAESNMTNENIMTFSTDDEVLTLLAEGATNSNTRLLRCDAPAAIPDVDKEKTSYANKKRRLKAKVKYQRGGIYFSLLAKGKNQKKRLGIWFSDGGGWGTIYYDCQFQTRCINAPYNEQWSITEYDRKVTYRPYEGIIRLEYYSLHTYIVSSNGPGVGLDIEG